MKPEKYLIFDAGPLISLTMNGLLPLIEKMKEAYPNTAFVLTPQVKREVIDKPMKIKKYMLEAVKITHLLEKGILQDSKDFLDNNTLAKETARFIKVSNEVIRANGKKVEIVHEGEASCMAFAKLIQKENLIVIDERTTRLLSEDPQNIASIMERRIHSPVEIIEAKLSEFKDLRYIRSSELVYLALKNNLLDLNKDKETLLALMYGLKYKGTAITMQEIEEMKNLL